MGELVFVSNKMFLTISLSGIWSRFPAQAAQCTAAQPSRSLNRIALPRTHACGNCLRLPFHAAVCMGVSPALLGTLSLLSVRSLAGIKWRLPLKAAKWSSVSPATPIFARTFPPCICRRLLNSSGLVCASLRSSDTRDESAILKDTSSADPASSCQKRFLCHLFKLENYFRSFAVHSHQLVSCQ